MKDKGIDLNNIRNTNINLKSWVKGFKSVKDSVIKTCLSVKEHPLVPKDFIVHGLIIDPNSAKLDLVVKGY